MSNFPENDENPQLVQPRSTPAQESAPPPGSVSVQLPASTPRVSYVILGLTVIVYVLQLASQFLLNFDLPVVLGIKSNDAIRAGQLWRLLTPMLLHGSILHIGFNMYALLIFGTNLERRYGHGKFLLLYVLAGFAGNVFSFLLTNENSLGASTAIFGLIGAEGVFLYTNRRLFGRQSRQAIGNIAFIVAINLFLGLQPGIDNWGHIGGLLGGLIFAWFAGPRWEVEGIYPALKMVDRRELRDVLVGAALVIILFGILAAFGIAGAGSL